MGKLTDSLLGGSSGRIGRLVVANVYGTEILRVRPRKTTKPASINQVLVRQRMSSGSKFLNAYRAYACKHFGYRAGLKSQYNLAMRNIIEAFTIDIPTESIQLNYPSVEFSKGNLLGLFPTGINSPTANTLTINWINNATTIPERETDWLQVLICINNQLDSMFFENVQQRITQTVQITLPNTYQGQNIHVWAAFRDNDQKNVSNSLYLGDVTIL